MQRVPSDLGNQPDNKIRVWEYHFQYPRGQSAKHCAVLSLSVQTGDKGKVPLPSDRPPGASGTTAGGAGCKSTTQSTLEDP